MASSGGGGRRVYLDGDAAALRGYDAIYVSPHLDDVAFSCAGLILEQRAQGLRILVVTIFTHADPRRCANEYSNYAPRFQEDEASMRLLGADFLYADFEDMVFRSGVAERSCCVALRLLPPWIAGMCCAPSGAASGLPERLARCLCDILARTGCTWLLGPAAMGYHPDHLLVHDACRAAKLRVPSIRLSFYDDWPYRTMALLRLPRLLVSSLRRRKVKELRLSDELLRRKEAAVCCYVSQVGPLFGGGDAARGAKVLAAKLRADRHERLRE
eukprot:TRINITY_DN54312_c0_g1_i1.p1 TRINITY_DN54312_c0_g1~~TRINITY_DN54312_c0_g1_i1.p1  ORF type:complete len:311 (-),score=56.95 TRINITY_DN54312_c0_g1_i1:42-854(-)